MSEETQLWVTASRVRAHQSWHTSNYTYCDLVQVYEALHARWNDIEWGGQMIPYLDALSSPRVVVDHVRASKHDLGHEEYAFESPGGTESASSARNLSANVL